MKKIVIILVSLFSYLNVFSQTRMDVWNKNPNTSRTISNLKPSQLPKSFESSLPDGSTEIYDKWDVPTVEVETSTKKKYTFKPKAYKGRKSFSVLTYTENGWEGMYQSTSGVSYSMTPSSIIKDTIRPKESLLGCESIIPPNESFQKLPQNTLPETSNLTNTDYYNPLIPINKNLTVYVEVTNNLHVILGNNVTTTQNWVTNLFLAVANIYSKEGLTVVLNKIYIWQTVDPYGYQTLSTPQLILGGNSIAGSQYGIGFSDNIRNNLPVNPNNTTTGVTSYFKHLLHGRGSFGGIAWLGGFSDGYNLSSSLVGTQFSCAVSGISSSNALDFNGNQIPLSSSTYNWPVYVVSHEMGHNCGSKHTHWCGWRNDVGGIIGRIDSCYTGEGCVTTPCPANCTSTSYGVTKLNRNGTIMSYCHINGQVNFSRGFGKYPRFTMRSGSELSTIPYSNVSPPTVTTSSVTSITSTTASSGGNLTSDGGGNLLSKGVCWAVSPTTPTISNSTTNDGIATGVYTSSLTGLSANTTYNVRAYATNSGGTSYGSTVTFTTSAPSMPTLTTTAISAIGQTSATSGGTITTDGGASITSKGVVWSTSTGPTIALSTKTSNGSGSTAFTSSLASLTPGTFYYVRAYASNSVGTGYGNEVTFTTLPIAFPTLTTTSVTIFDNITATMGGNVTSTGGGTVTARGVCYATTQNPDLTKTVVTIGSGIGTFSQSVTGLSQGVTYYVRSYATNSAGTSYGTQVSFKTLTSPTVTTTAATNIASTSFTTGGNVTSAGGGALTVTDRGVCYATTTNPTTLNSVVSGGSGTGTFTANITGLLEGVTYYVRAYAVNTYGTSYGSQITVKTLTVPTVTTTSASSITTTSFNSGGNVTSAGGGTLTVTDRGVCYATTSTPTISNSIVSSGTGTGTYTVSITGLITGTVYYARAYATNSLGTGYGSQITITTPSIPVLTTTAITSLSSSGASSGGTISSSIGSNVTSKGVVWSTSPNPTIALSTKTSNGTGTTTFTSTITGLSSSTTYYVRSYATNTTGTGYGNELTFTTTSSGSVPSLTTTTVTSITQTTASSGGNVTSDGGLSVTARGVVWSTSISPTIALSTKTSNGTGTGSFTSSITGLTQNTTYYVRAYATNSNGTNYGTEQSFTTLPTNTIPVVTTTSVTSITSTGASTGGNVTSAGGLTVTERGVCYATTQTPTIANSVVISGLGTGSFTSSLSGLTASTIYYVRAYATNSLGTAYGSQQSFTTLANNTIPVVTTTTVTSITQTTASSGGNVTSAGGLTVTERGVCYATTQTPTIANSIVTSGTGTGSFTSSITGLSPSTTYYLRAYATNSLGTAYGSQQTFTTLANSTTPDVTTTTVTNITQTTASSGGNVTSDGGLAVTSRGVCYATTQNPSIANSIVASGTGTGSFTSSITGLSASTTYYLRAYATNSLGTAYGTQQSFTTLATNTIPVVTTTSITSITTTSASTGGNVTGTGGLTVTARGVCYATTQTPTIANSVVTSGSGTGSFTSSITGLTQNTTYYVRAYATNSLGTAYGSQLTFTTLNSPTVTTTAASSVSSNTATTGGNVTNDGGATVTERGVCYATTQNPTIANSIFTSGTGTGSFTSNLSGLSENTTYYVRAYATNSVGTSYGSQISFTTITGATLPTVTTTTSSSVTATSAASGGNVTSGGSQPVTSRGVCWSTSPNPTIALSTKTSDGTGPGVFTSTLTPLLASTTYYARAYATSSLGTSYGGEISFTTSVAPSNTCVVNNLSAYKSGSLWFYRWDINANCNSYTVSLSKYAYQDINVQPPSNATPVTTGIRLTNYVPLSAEITQGFVNKQMASAPQSLGFWYSVDVKCNATTCSGTNTTKSFFWVP